MYLHIQVCFLSWYQVPECPEESKEDLSVWSLYLFYLVLNSPAVEKLQFLSDEEWTIFLSQLCSSIEEQNRSTSVLPSSAPPASTTIRSKLNLLCYLCCVVGHTVIANRLINSRVVGKPIFALGFCWNVVGWLGLLSTVA